MSKGLPSMTALLGLLAMAGYQNREKIAEMLGGLTGGGQGPGGQSGPGGQAKGQSETSGGLGGLLGGLGGAGAGGLLGGGLGELIDRFSQAGHRDTVDSWVKSGPNKEIAGPQLESCIGPEVLATLSQQTGMSREELVSRLCRELPTAVDRYTPEGQMPSFTDAGWAR